MTMERSPTAAASPTTAPPTREYRAMWTFAISAALLVVGLLFFGNQAGAYIGGGQGAVFAALLGLVTTLIEARGLSERRDWARYAMTPLLWIFVGAAVLIVIVALGRNSLNIPVGGILAAWALAARPSEAIGRVPTSSTEGTLLIVVSALAAVIQFF